MKSYFAAQIALRRCAHPKLNACLRLFNKLDKLSINLISSKSAQKSDRSIKSDQKMPEENDWDWFFVGFDLKGEINQENRAQRIMNLSYIQYIEAKLGIIP